MLPLVLTTFLFSQGSVPDDWQAVKTVLFSSLDSVFQRVAFPETLAIVALHPEGLWSWVLTPLLEEYAERRGAIVRSSASTTLRFLTLQLRLQKTVTGLWGRTLHRTVYVKCWVSVQTPSRTRQWIVSGTFEDQYPPSLNAETEIEGLSPPVRHSVSWPQQVLASLVVGGLLYMLYSGGR